MTENHYQSNNLSPFVNTAVKICWECKSAFPASLAKGIQPVDGLTAYVCPACVQKEYARAKNEDILSERMRAYDAIQGPRVGDWLDTPKGQFRIAYRLKDAVQPTMYTAEENYGFYLGGAISYSGSLGEPVQLDRLQPTEEKRAALVWFFSENDVRAHNSVYLKADFRVFRLV